MDVDETSRFVTEAEHEGESVKEPSVPEVFPVFVRSLLGHTSSFTSLVALLSLRWCPKSRRALGSWAHVQLRCGLEGDC